MIACGLYRPTVLGQDLRDRESFRYCVTASTTASALPSGFVTLRLRRSGPVPPAHSGPRAPIGSAPALVRQSQKPVKSLQLPLQQSPSPAQRYPMGLHWQMPSKQMPVQQAGPPTTQGEPRSTQPPPSTIPHVPPWQTPATQPIPHSPQLAGSVWRSTQTPLQLVRPAPQSISTQTLSIHCSIKGSQGLSQAPQWKSSLVRSRHWLPHRSSPSGQASGSLVASVVASPAAAAVTATAVRRETWPEPPPPPVLPLALVPPLYPSAVADVAAAGGLRAGVTVDEAADLVWATNAPEFYLLLVEERGWDPERFEHWLAELWSRMLLP